MTLISMQIVKSEKNFKGKRIAGISYLFCISSIFLSLKDRELTISADMFNQGHGSLYISSSKIQGNTSDH